MIARPDPESARQLGRLVNAEARRASSELAQRTNPVRAAAGWKRRFIVEQGRVPEFVELYRALGYEVEADPAGSQLQASCEACALAAALRFAIIYTRRASP